MLHAPEELKLHGQTVVKAFAFPEGAHASSVAFSSIRHAAYRAAFDAVVLVPALRHDGHHLVGFASRVHPTAVKTVLLRSASCGAADSILPRLAGFGGLLSAVATSATTMLVEFAAGVLDVVDLRRRVRGLLAAGSEPLEVTTVRGNLDSRILFTQVSAPSLSELPSERSERSERSETLFHHHCFHRPGFFAQSFRADAPRTHSQSW